MAGWGIVLYVILNVLKEINWNIMENTTLQLRVSFLALLAKGNVSFCHHLQGFQSGPVPGTFTRLRSCIVPAEITESPKISGGQNHKYDDGR
jgi:hypothetical protein